MNSVLDIIKRPKHFILTAMGLMISPVTFAAQAPDYSIHQEYTSTRAMGMGNAFTAVVDDHSSLFYNPAALINRKDTQVHMYLRGGANPEYVDFVNDIDAAGSDENAIVNTIQNYYGEHMYSRFTLLGATIVRPKWSMAIVPVDWSTDITPHGSLPSVYVNSYIDTTIAYGRAKLLKLPKTGKLAFGWSAKLLHRAFYSDAVQAIQLAMDEDIVDEKKSAEGATLDADIGFLYKFNNKEKTWLPTLGLTVRNLFDYGFPTNFGIFNDDDPAEPPKLQRRMDVGAKFDLPYFWVFEPKFAVDIRDMGHDNWTPKKGFHAGTELYWRMANWWKGHWSVGINQGYWTAGFGARLGIFQLDIASWGEEVGTSDAEQESRRYLLEMSLDF
jgi:hypothetical protein